MSKKKESTSKAKAAKEEIPEEKLGSKKTETQEELKGLDLMQNKSAESTETTKEVQTPSEEKESITELKNTVESFGYKEAEKRMDVGKVVALPEWKGFWFKSHKDTSKTLVLTKDGEILETPHEEYKDREDWIEVEPTAEQSKILEDYWVSKEQYDDYMSLKVIAYNPHKGCSFVKTKQKISISDLLENKNIPLDASSTSEFVMSNNKVFDLESRTLTERVENNF